MAALLAATVFMAYSTIATATHQPADKVQASGSDLEHVETDGTVLLEETMRVSSPADLILQVTAECSILTELITGPSAAGTGGTAATDNAFAFGSVRLSVTIDGTPVPVATDDLAENATEDDLEDDDSTLGEVTFCNRAYERTVTDGEDDGLDEEHDYIRTRTANAFNWFAIDAGGDYYDKDGDNLLTIQVLADYDTTTSGDAVADAFVGSRTLIVEPVHSQNDQQVGPGPVEASPSGKK